MNMLSTNKLGATALIVGPTLAFVMYLLQPGGLLVEPTNPSDVSGTIAAWMENSALTRLTSVFIMLGLMGMAFGIYEVHVAHRGSRGDGLTMGGLAFVSLCIVAWVFAQALTMPIAVRVDMAPGAQEAVHAAREGLIIVGGMAGCVGILLFSIAVIIDSRGRAFLVLSWIAAISSVVGLVAWITASAGGDALDPGLRIARSLYFIWVVWFISLGVRLAREESEG